MKWRVSLLAVPLLFSLRSLQIESIIPFWELGIRQKAFVYEKIVSAMSCIILLTGRARLVTCQLLQHVKIAQTSILHLFVKVSVKIFIFLFHISCQFSWVGNFLSTSRMTYNNENWKRQEANKKNCIANERKLSQFHVHALSYTSTWTKDLGRPRHSKSLNIPSS